MDARLTAPQSQGLPNKSGREAPQPEGLQNKSGKEAARPRGREGHKEPDTAEQ